MVFWPIPFCKYYILHVKIQLFVTFKSNQDPDPHWFGSLDPDPDLDSH
jgi:hypothetical protein